MHRHIAELAVSLIVNHRVVKQVALVYAAGVWVLISTELIDNLHIGSHIMLDDCELSEVAVRLDEQVTEWRATGHDVRCRHRHAEPVDAG